MSRTQDLSYCGRQVRRYDHDRFLTSLFAPAARREGLLALYAFNVEIAKTAEVVSEAMLGQIRLQWWREAIEALYAGAPPEHEVALALAGPLRDSGLTRGFFARLIDSREQDLDPAPPPNLDALERYAVESSSTLVWLALELLGARGEAADKAARHIGIAWSLTGLLRAVPFHARQRRLYLPADHLSTAGVDRADIFELRGSEQVSGVVMRLAKRAREHLEAARAERPKVARAAVPALLPGYLADRYLRALEGVDFNPFDPRLQAKPAVGVGRLSLAALRGRY